MRFPLPGHAPLAWLLCLCAALLWPLAAHAQGTPAPAIAPAADADEAAEDGASTPGAVAQRRTRAPGGPRFEIDMQAPEAIGDFLLRHMELQRYRELRNLDANELGRLLAQAPANLRELLATLGHFKPMVEVSAPPGLDDALAQGEGGATPANPSPRQLGTVTIRVEPGPVTQVVSVNVSFVGDIAQAPEAAAQRADIQREAALIENLPFSQSDWDAAKTAALRRLIAQRYPLGRVQNSLADIDAEAHQARLYIELDSGRAMRMGDVVVQGADRYAAITAWYFVGSYALVMLIDFTEFSSRTSGLPGFTVKFAFAVSALRVPMIMQQTVPFIGLLSAIATLVSLNRKYELVIARSAGISACPPVLN